MHLVGSIVYFITMHGQYNIKFLFCFITKSTILHSTNILIFNYNFHILYIHSSVSKTSASSTKPFWLSVLYVLKIFSAHNITLRHLKVKWVQWTTLRYLYKLCQRADWLNNTWHACALLVVVTSYFQGSFGARD